MLRLLGVTSASADTLAAFRHEGEYWTIAFDGVVCRLRDSAGLRYVAHLLQRPGEKVAAAELVRAARTPRNAARAGAPDPHQTEVLVREAELARVRTTRSIRSALQRISAHNAMLIAHLSATIKTGTYCSYSPDPRLPVEWKF